MADYSTLEGRQMIIDWLEWKLKFIRDHGIPDMNFTQTDIADILEALRGRNE